MTTATQKSKKTTIPTYPVEKLQNVVGYSEENERIRQALISGNFEMDSVEGEFDANFKNMAIRIARSKSDTYNGGYWDFNEHGLLTLVTSAETLEFDSAYRTHKATTEEFAFAVSMIAANQMLWQPSIPEHTYSYFEYLYHLSHCILGKAKTTNRFNKAEVGIMVD